MQYIIPDKEYNVLKWVGLVALGGNGTGTQLWQEIMEAHVISEKEKRA